MPEPGLWISIGGGKLADAVVNSIETKDQFTTTVTALDVSPKAAELAIVSVDGERVDYIGVSEAGRRVATGQRTIAISNLITIEGLSCEEIRKRLPKRLEQWFSPPEFGPYRPSPKLWEEIISIIRSRGSHVRTKMSDLGTAIADARRRRGSSAAGLEAFERDAVASALQTWGGTSLRKRVLRRAHASDGIAPFLSQLKDVPLREDPEISHDHATFPGMEVARRDVVGSILLRNGNEELTILNCNRHPLEQTLGVDLIYYSHRFRSFVMVQYKRMLSGNSGPEYRPDNDSSHAKEIQRMLDAEKLLGALPKSIKGGTLGFRLSARPFYVKLCEAKAKAALDGGMVSGMYIPLGLWRRLLNSPKTRGPKGGVSITWRNCTRRFSNSEFTNLLRNGWIGSTSAQSQKLSEIIEEVLGSGRMLVLAATSKSVDSRDLRRDPLGRFAAHDDPSGAL